MSTEECRGALHFSDESKGLELQTAKEILAEVFRVRLSDVDEMIQNRFQVEDERRFKEGELWPQELWVEG